MANRILLHPAGMKVSVPGVNVLTAGPENLLFNSDWSGHTIGARGSLYVGGFGDYAISLPRAFSQNALVMCEAAGRVLGGCRITGNSRVMYAFVATVSSWRLTLVDAYTLLLRHRDYSNAELWPNQQAGPPFPYILNYAVIDV